MGTENFETEACKEILMNPRSVKEVQCKKLKLNINSTDDLKFFRCFYFQTCNLLSNFRTSRCHCGSFMSKEIEVCIHIITDDLKVAVRSTDLVLQKLKSVGCCDFSKVGERSVHIGFEEVMTLLQCILSSNAPLTDAFLNEKIPKGVRKTCPYMVRKIDETEADQEEVITMSVIARKHDMKILYVECGEDFVDLLFTFLAVPLESVLDISDNGSSFGCLGNLFKSFKDLSATQVSISNSVLPHYYKCKKQLLNIITEQPRALKRESNLEPLVLIDPKSHGGDQSKEGSGFAKKDTKFAVMDDLIVTPMSSISTYCLLKKFHIQAEDLIVQEISITKTKATHLLRASLLTSFALNIALKNLLLKNPKQET